MESVPPAMARDDIQADSNRTGFAPRREPLSFKQSDVDGIAVSDYSTCQQLSKQPKDRKRDSTLDLTEQFGKFPIEKYLKWKNYDGKAMKTPVSVLQEILSRQGITPSYELVQIEGAIHQPTFRYRVTFTDKVTSFTAMGAGRSKKEAKHAAARALIERLCGAAIPDDPWVTDSEQQTDADGNTCKRDFNPISWLQDFCMQKRWPPPKYETEHEKGLPHERLFTIACSILSLRELGVGKSKKLAKRLAAEKMWKRLTDNPEEQEKAAKEVTYDMSGINLPSDNYFNELRGTTIPILDSESSLVVSRFLKCLSSKGNKELRKLQRICLRDPTIESKKLLKDIAWDSHFEVTYVDIEELTLDGRYQCLVQLSTMPVGVCHGTADTREEAQRKAALNALEYLKIITKN